MSADQAEEVFGDEEYETESLQPEAQSLAQSAQKKKKKSKGDPYSSSELAEDSKMFDEDMANFNKQEKSELKSSINAGELEEIQKNGKNLFSEITSGMKDYGKNQFWRKKKFFQEHM